MREARCAPTHDDIAKFAYEIWERETNRMGTPDVPVSEELTVHNWLTAEKLLNDKWAEDCRAEDAQ